jgi:hypothetical protein
MKLTTLTFATTLTLMACTRTEVPETPPAPAPPPLVQLQSPVAAGSDAPGLTTGPDGKLYLSWVETADDGGQLLRFSTRAQGEWSAPQMVAKGMDWFVSAVDAPSITAFADGTLAADWFTATQIETEAYDTKIAFSKDGGATWGNAISPHRDKKKRQHGFLSVVPTSANQLTAVWLDGKNLPEDLIGDMALVATTVGTDGKLGPEMELDARVCECCHTARASVADGLVGAYRDRSDQEIRDIAMVRFSNGAWSAPESVAKDGWQIDACPINGPAISVSGQNVAVAWFTAPQDVAQVNVVTSTDGGKTFGKPVRVDEGKPDGHVDVVSLPSGGSVVSWLERSQDGVRVKLRQVNAAGVAGMPIAISEGTSPSESVPQIERSGNDIVVAWTDDSRNIKTTVVQGLQ